MPSHAQTPVQAVEEGLRRQEERSREQLRAQEPKADALSPDAGKAASKEFPQEAQCFVIHEIGLRGKDSARFAWLMDTALPYLRRCIGVKGLGFVAAELDGALRDAGYATTRLALPPQNLRAGQLLLQVEAGRVADIRMVNADAPSNGPAGATDTPDRRWGTWRNAFPVAAGDVLNVRDLEQGVENMRRLPSQSVATRLEPGEEANSSIVVIERKTGALSDRARGGITFDNSGGPSLGRTQMSVNLAFDNPAGLNDVVTASFNTNAERATDTHRSQGASISYSIPWGFNLFSLSASNSRFAQYVQGTTVRFLSSGRSSSVELKLGRTLWRGASSRLEAHAALSTRSAASYLDDVELLVQRRRTTTIETGVSYRHLFEASSIDLDLSLRRGMPWRGAQEDLATAGAGGLTLRPHIWTLNAAYTADLSPAGQPLRYSASLRAQQTGDATLSVDQIAIGGRSSVRGFDGDSVLMAESGFVLRNEFTAPIRLVDGVDTSALLAIDYGRVWGPSDILLTGRELAGVAVGVRGRSGSLQFEAALAAPLRRPSGFTSRNLNLYATLTQSF